jgi:hypothetical protein
MDVNELYTTNLNILQDGLKMLVSIGFVELIT